MRELIVTLHRPIEYSANCLKFCVEGECGRKVRTTILRILHRLIGCLSLGRALERMGSYRSLLLGLPADIFLRHQRPLCEQGRPSALRSESCSARLGCCEVPKATASRSPRLPSDEASAKTWRPDRRTGATERTLDLEVPHQVRMSAESRTWLPPRTRWLDNGKFSPSLLSSQQWDYYPMPRQDVIQMRTLRHRESDIESGLIAQEQRVWICKCICLHSPAPHISRAPG
ncbi:uncharacterized protein LOC117796439 [Ailuropoda melanoleuca]|uniref:uncharacterized protein LOC117796439 n=1 Tax=Ailuropoda melanoleuca TaxID=9646 RepID=UPI001494B65E|nr:uncharacterized protein LOC117796439 [Ailuropoda melanoleuca]